MKQKGELTDFENFFILAVIFVALYFVVPELDLSVKLVISAFIALAWCCCSPKRCSVVENMFGATSAKLRLDISKLHACAKRNFVGAVVIVVCFLVLYFLVYPFIQGELKRSPFVPRFSDALWRTLHIVVNPLVFSFVTTLVLLKFCLAFKRKRAPGFWILLTLIVMGLLGFVGVSIINYYFGYPDFTFQIKECGTDILLGNLRCKDNPDGPYSINHRACDFPPGIKAPPETGSIFQMLINGSGVPDAFSDLNFIGNENATHVNFSFMSDKNNNPICGEGNGSVRFYTNEENKERARNLITNLTWLIGGILFLVPSMMYHLKKLSE